MSKQEILKRQYLNFLRDLLYDRLHYSNRQVRISYHNGVITFTIKTLAVNLDYINEFVASLDKNEAKTFFNDEEIIFNVKDVEKKKKRKRFVIYL